MAQFNNHNEFRLGALGSTYLTGDGDLIDLTGATSTAYVCAITMGAATTFEKLENLNGEIGSISTVTAENDLDGANGIGASANGTDVTSSHSIAAGVTIYGKWDHVELNSGSCICYFAPKGY